MTPPQRRPDRVRATALDFLQPVSDPAIVVRAAPLLDDLEPPVREATAAVQVGAPAAERSRRLQPALEDPLRAAPITAAHALLGKPSACQPPEFADAMQVSIEPAGQLR